MACNLRHLLLAPSIGFGLLGAVLWSADTAARTIAGVDTLSDSEELYLCEEPCSGPVLRPFIITDHHDNRYANIQELELDNYAGIRRLDSVSFGEYATVQESDYPESRGGRLEVGPLYLIRTEQGRWAKFTILAAEIPGLLYPDFNRLPEKEQWRLRIEEGIFSTTSDTWPGFIVLWAYQTDDSPHFATETPMQRGIILPRATSADFDDNGRVGMADFLLFAQHFNQPVTEANYAFDLNWDEQLDFEDFFRFVDQFGRQVEDGPAHEQAPVLEPEHQGPPQWTQRITPATPFSEYWIGSLAFSTDSGIAVANPHRVRETFIQADSIWNTTWAPVGDLWAPLGLAYDIKIDGNWEIWVDQDIHSDEKADERVEGNITNDPADDMHPTWGPRSQYTRRNPNDFYFDYSDQIAFETNRDGNWEIYRMFLDEAYSVNLTNHPAQDRYAAWDPASGASIVFASDRDGNWEIYSMDIYGTDPINLTNHPADDILPAWSPFGQKLTFSTNRDGNWEIYSMDVSGYDQVNLTNHPDHDFISTWMPDGCSILFERRTDDNWRLLWMNADGSYPQDITEDFLGWWGEPSVSPAPSMSLFFQYR